MLYQSQDYKDYTNIKTESEMFYFREFAMSETKQNLVVFMEPQEVSWRITVKAGNMYLNRFCIDEDSAFELSEINYLKKIKFEAKNPESKEKGKGS